MPDLVLHDRQPSAFLVYLQLWHRSSARQPRVHISHQAMAEEQSLLQPSAYTHAQGARPLWEVAKLPDAIPLGDVARALREEHTVVRKSEVVWVNQ